MTHRKYQEHNLTKKETEVVEFLETGSSNFWESYYSYSSRKKRMDRPTLTIATWFNKVIKSLHDKGLFLEVPFVLNCSLGFIWENPGVNASKANFECLTLQDAVMEERSERHKLII